MISSPDIYKMVPDEQNEQGWRLEFLENCIEAEELLLTTSGGNFPELILILSLLGSITDVQIRPPNKTRGPVMIF